MAGFTLFISDLHLAGQRPDITGLFLKFLHSEARHADALYILGDLFEYWIGDEQVDWPEYQPVVAALRSVAGAGIPVRVIVGNRDFLMGAGFESATGAQLLPDNTRIDLYGERVLVTHGDELCTRDTEFMKFRHIVRTPTWRNEFLAKTIDERRRIAGEYREISQQNMLTKKPEIMDVTPEAVDAALRAYGVRHMIHGHTHRPAQHRFLLDGQPARRTVLGDWYEQGSVLRCTGTGCELQTLTA